MTTLEEEKVETSELTPRQMRERAAYEAEKTGQKATSPRMSTRDYLRKQAGWPALRKDNNR